MYTGVRPNKGILGHGFECSYPEKRQDGHTRSSLNLPRRSAVSTFVRDGNHVPMTPPDSFDSSALSRVEARPSPINSRSDANGPNSAGLYVRSGTSRIPDLVPEYGLQSSQELEPDEHLNGRNASVLPIDPVQLSSRDLTHLSGDNIGKTCASSDMHSAFLTLFCVYQINDKGSR